MPLFIPNRPSGTFASHRNGRTSPEHNGHSGGQARPGYLKMYPLEAALSRPERRPSANRHPERQTRAADVKPEYTMAPPQRRGSAAPDPVRNSIGQTIPRNNATQRAVPRPHSPAGNHTQQPPHQPVTPEDAVQFFRKANKGLPDGVRYEPLDDTTMRLLRENGHLPPAPDVPQGAGQQVQTPPQLQPQSPVSMPGAAARPPSLPQMPPGPMPATPWSAPQNPGTILGASPPPSPAVTPESQHIVKMMEGLIQDERNAHIFYSNLAKIAPERSMELSLSDIASDSSMHISNFSHTLLKQFGHGFAPVEVEINTGLGLKDALALALTEENKSLRKLTEVLEKVANTESEKVIQRAINKKIVNYNQLERLFSVA